MRVFTIMKIVENRLRTFLLCIKAFKLHTRSQTISFRPALRTYIQHGTMLEDSTRCTLQYININEMN